MCSRSHTRYDAVRNHELMQEKLGSLKKRLDAAKARAGEAEPGAPKVAPVELDDKACLEGGPKDWCSTQERMFHNVK